MVMAMAIQAKETYGDILSPILAHLKNIPVNLMVSRFLFQGFGKQEEEARKKSEDLPITITIH
jgi:hypothetical protein